MSDFENVPVIPKRLKKSCKKKEKKSFTDH